MLFHVGSLWRLNELGCLRDLNAISSVSGGSIVAGLLASRWSELKFNENGTAENFRELIADPLMALAGNTLADWKTVGWTLVASKNATTKIESTYNGLFNNKTLGEMPDKPAFIFNSASLQTGSLWTFEKRRSGDKVVGDIPSSNIRIAGAVMASSAFPPFLSPYRLNVTGADWAGGNLSALPTGTDFQDFRKQPLLSDGGIIDNLGLESLWNTPYIIFASDGGGRFRPTARPSVDWARQTQLVVSIIHGQHDVLRTGILIERFRKRKPDGLMWTIHNAACHHDVFFSTIPDREIKALAELPTELSTLDDTTKKKLVNWGYIADDRSLPYLDRAWKSLRPNTNWSENESQPYPDAKLTLRPFEKCVKHQRYRDDDAVSTQRQ